MLNQLDCRHNGVCYRGYAPSVTQRSCCSLSIRVAYLDDELAEMSHVVDRQPAEDVGAVVVDYLERFCYVEVLQH